MQDIMLAIADELNRHFESIVAYVPTDNDSAASRAKGFIVNNGMMISSGMHNFHRNLVILSRSSKGIVSDFGRIYYVGSTFVLKAIKNTINISNFSQADQSIKMGDIVVTYVKRYNGTDNRSRTEHAVKIFDINDPNFIDNLTTYINSISQTVASGPLGLFPDMING